MQTVHTDDDSNDSSPSHTSKADSNDSRISQMDANLLEYIKGLLLAANDKHIEIKKVGLLNLIEQYEKENPQESDETVEPQSDGSESDSSQASVDSAGEPSTKRSKQSDSESESDSSETSSGPTEIEDFILDEDQVSFLLSFINLAIDNKISINDRILCQLISSLEDPPHEGDVGEN